MDIVQRVGPVDPKTNHYNMCVGVRQRPQPIIVIHPRSIPKSELDMLPVDLNIRDVVFEGCGEPDLTESENWFANLAALGYVNYLWKGALRENTVQGE